MSITRKDLLAAVVGGAIVMVLAGGVAWAAIPAVPGGVIQGCYDSGGNIEVCPGTPVPGEVHAAYMESAGATGSYWWATGAKGENGHSRNARKKEGGGLPGVSGVRGLKGGAKQVA